jgi:hypothetical protein
MQELNWTLLTLLSKLRPEKLRQSELVKKFLSCYGNRYIYWTLHRSMTLVRHKTTVNTFPLWFLKIHCCPHSSTAFCSLITMQPVWMKAAIALWLWNLLDTLHFAVWVVKYLCFLYIHQRNCYSYKLLGKGMSLYCVKIKKFRKFIWTFLDVMLCFWLSGPRFLAGLQLVRFQRHSVQALYLLQYTIRA